MARKQRKRSTAGKYQLPPHVTRARQAAASTAAWKPRPRLPGRRLILGEVGITLLCFGMVLAFWLPADSLVRDLRSRGVTVTAEVTGVDNKPTYVEVRFVQGPERGTEVKLSDYAGMYPDIHAGESLTVTYDPDNPTRNLAHKWVVNPPPNLPAYGTSALAVFFLAGTVAVMLRRRWILKKWPSESSDSDTGSPHTSKSEEVRLTKP